MNRKVYSYLGFAKKSGNLITGADTCTQAANKGKLKMLLIAEDVADNTLKKIENFAKNRDIPYRVFGDSEELSHSVGSSGRYVFGIKSSNFADVLLNEIDRENAEEKEELS